MGSDAMPMKMIKLFKFSFLPIKTFLLYLSIKNCIFPTSWEKAEIIALLKKVVRMT